MIKERYTLMLEYIEGEEIIDRRTASLEREAAAISYIWDWLPEAFKAIGHTTMGESLDEAKQYEQNDEVPK